MRINLFWALSAIASFLFFDSGCATSNQTPSTQLQMREFQTRSYDTDDTKMVMKAMLNVLQDDGFIVKDATLDLGFFTAEKSVKMDLNGEEGKQFVKRNIWKLTFGQSNSMSFRQPSFIKSIECTSNISEYGKQTRVRINFLKKIIDNTGGVIDVQQIDDEKYYQEFFSKMTKGVFIQKEKI